MTEQEEIQIQRRVTKLEELLRESLEHMTATIQTRDLKECPECHQKNRPSTKTRCDRCFSESAKGVLGIKPRPF